MTEINRITSRREAYKDARRRDGKQEDYLPQFFDDDGNLCVFLGPRTKPEVVRIDRMVAETFLGPEPPNCQGVRHKDGDPANCRADNLEWIVVE